MVILKQHKITLLAASLAFSCSVLPIAQADENEEMMVVVGKNSPERMRDVAETITVVSGDDLRARGANDLRTALAQVAGVDIGPGGDAGPASAVPSIWGLREFDAFLLVVDGIPAGGVFTPALTSLDISNVKRIEVLKGAAPVSYGATSFVGVINVVHYAAGEGPTTLAAGVGSRSSYHASFASPLTSNTSTWRSSLLLNAEKQELSADRAQFERAHLLSRNAAELGTGEFTADADISLVRQKPVSPHLREGKTLSERTPLDANYNPHGAKLDENREQLALGYVVDSGLGNSSTHLAITHTNNSNVRGFLRGGETYDDPNSPDFGKFIADGYQQKINRDEVYFDSHFTSHLGNEVTLIWGLDHTSARGEQTSNNFEYPTAVFGDGSDTPSFLEPHVDEQTHLKDTRQFSGVYADFDFDLTERWKLETGLRFNRTTESSKASVVGNPYDPAPDVDEPDGQSQLNRRWSGALKTSYRLWDHDADYMTLYYSYRKTFKPAVVDFGPEVEGDMLKPEDADSHELGLRGKNFDGRWSWDIAVFDMKFRNLVVIQDGGVKANAGEEHFKGAELETRWAFTDAFSAVATYTYHSALFGDYVQTFDVPTQLKDKHLEMSPQNLASLGFLYADKEGLRFYANANHVGRYFLNKRNTAPATDYTTYDAGVGYALKHWEFRVDLYNISDRRDPVAESEQGDGQYYLMPARSSWFNVSYTF